MTIINVSFPVRVVVTPMAGANNSTLRRDLAVSAANEHGTLNREGGHQIFDQRRIFTHYENILHQRRSSIADYLLTISDNLTFSSSVTSAFAKPQAVDFQTFVSGNHNAAKHSRQNNETFTIPYLGCELTASPRSVEAA